MQTTAFYPQHLAASAKIVDFAGWQMPLHYGSQVEEHHIVRRSAGMFDVSHMVVTDITGEQSEPFLRYLLANDVQILKNGKALYSCMLNEKGGILDDLIVYRINEKAFRIVSNAGTREKDLSWINQQAAAFSVQISTLKDIALLAIQGPQSIAALSTLFPEIADKLAILPRFQFLEHQSYFIARTGYTGEDGVEIIFPAKNAAILWQKLLATNVKPCGLGSRDTLRLEAGMHLYGNDMNEEVTPFESGLAWTVNLQSDRDFIGKKALLQQKANGIKQQLVGLMLSDRGVLRAHQSVILTGIGEGEITSGTFSPTLQCTIAMARIPNLPVDEIKVIIRDKAHIAKIVKLPFVKKIK